MIAAFVVFFPGGDNEIAVFDVRVLWAVGVSLEFVIAPAVAAEVVSPFFGVWGGAVGAVEFVRPDEGEAFQGRGLSGCRLRGLLRE